MPKIAKELNALELRALGQGNHIVGGVPGLLLAVRGPSRVYVLRATVAGKRRSIGVGPASVLTLGQARDRARALRLQILDGGDPVEERRKAKAQRLLLTARLTTFSKAARDYIAANRTGWKNAKHSQQWESSLEMYAAPTLGAMTVVDIEPIHVLQVLTPIWSTKTETATRLRERIERVIAADDAKNNRQRLNPARWKGNLDAMLPPPRKVAKTKHHAAMDWRQIPQLAALLLSDSRVSAKALLWTILTGVRTSETRLMRWSEIDFENRLWRITGDRMKAGRPHVVPLTDAALACLPPVGQQDEFVFKGLKGKAISQDTMRMYLRRKGFSETVHGFRSTLTDWTREETTYPSEVLDLSLAHSIGDATKLAYARSDLLEKRRRHIRDWAAFVTSKIGQTTNVVPLGGRAA